MTSCSWPRARRRRRCGRHRLRGDAGGIAAGGSKFRARGPLQALARPSFFGRFSDVVRTVPMGVMFCAPPHFVFFLCGPSSPGILSRRVRCDAGGAVDASTEHSLADVRGYGSAIGVLWGPVCHNAEFGWVFRAVIAVQQRVVKRSGVRTGADDNHFRDVSAVHRQRTYAVYDCAAGGYADVSLLSSGCWVLLH